MRLPSWQAIWEGLKELGRIAFFAALAAAVGWLSEKTAGLDPNSVYYLVGTLVLRFADKVVHESTEIKASGLAPF